MYPSGGPAVAGDSCVKGTVVDVTELSPVGEVAKGAGKGPGEDHKASP